MSKPLNILISNDDGILATGINVLADEVSKQHQVTVVAPDKDRSGSSSALTLDRPLKCAEIKPQFFSISGTPCDCVHLGSHRLMQAQPDMVISGINRGGNLGDDVLYSGTVAAAMEGRSMGYPAIAVSLAGKECNHYATAAQVVNRLLTQLGVDSLSSNIILNVNVPDIPFENIRGYQITRLGCRHRADTIVPAQNPKGETVYWIGPASEPQDIGDGTDFNAVASGFVSITPLVIDLTAFNHSDVLTEWISKL